jgi:hypothetical protein
VNTFVAPALRDFFQWDEYLKHFAEDVTVFNDENQVGASLISSDSEMTEEFGDNEIVVEESNTLPKKESAKKRRKRSEEASPLFSKAVQDSQYAKFQAVEGLARRYLEQTYGRDWERMKFSNVMKVNSPQEKPAPKSASTTASSIDSVAHLRSYVSFSPPLLFLSRMHSKLSDRSLYAENELRVIEAWSLVLDKRTYPSVLCLSISHEDVDDIEKSTNERFDATKDEHANSSGIVGASARAPMSRFSHKLHESMMNNSYMIQKRGYHSSRFFSDSFDTRGFQWQYEVWKKDNLYRTRSSRLRTTVFGKVVKFFLK